MLDLVRVNNCIPAMTDTAIDKVRKLENLSLQAPQVDIVTVHSLHDGVYTRTIMIPSNVILTGALIKIPTTLIVCGDVTVFIGEKSNHIIGHHVMSASANRKQAFVAHADTYLTMIFKTEAKTVEEAEEQFTDEAHLLSSRAPGALNHFIITGE